MEMYCVSQQKVTEESLSEEEEEVTAKQQTSGAISEMLKAWKTVALYIENHHPNKAVAMRATNSFYYNTVFSSNFESSVETNVSRQLPSKRELDMRHNSYKIQQFYENTQKN
ncbi:hypothetical protein AVEN_31416-1 [Araneus ventricosus]|uniref:Uncharacterized protein n=1 Tax=Araneus ventricosus TaxID=182803 RepID=A0A4Y2F005_ARAVE|nr:hypothetical protein AVEN_31416-1 [Araneus ventricosus]